jgi:lipopolysaccharide transport system ATP-binding protein
MEETVFDVRNVGVYYKKASSLPWKSSKFWALQDVSFNVRRGETVGVIGRNGAGKSTLLKILADIIRPDRGSIDRADIKVTLQSLGAGFDQRLTGRQNIYLNGTLLGMSHESITRQLDDIIALADIGTFIDEPIKSYSSGMRSRLGFAIAYFIETDTILIDEALATGDGAFKEKASTLIKDKIKSHYTVVLVTHSLNLAEELCDRIIQIENGRSLPELPLKESIDRYMDTIRTSSPSI